MTLQVVPSHRISSLSQSVGQAVSQSVKQSVGQSVSQSVSRSVAHSITNYVAEDPVGWPPTNSKTRNKFSGANNRTSPSRFKMSSGVPFFMNGLYVSPCCNRYWQGIMILQGKANAGVTVQLLVRHLRLKTLQDIVSHTAHCVSRGTLCLTQPQFLVVI
jgi:hypothetical protein